MHVVPKAQLPGADDEKTTIEAQWEEEEASTTIDQGVASEKLRDLGLEPVVPHRTITGVTGTGAMEEPTVDDQHANPAIEAAMPGAARLVITQGVDAGKQFDIYSGKSFTIGRALENDIVLADIAVSRKHFDLRFEGGAWIIVDRGSGNGTVVNGNLEDHPFMLANGDAIEIGNTTFRFEQQAPPAAAPLPDAPAPTYDVDLDDEEPSTVAGKAVGHQKFETEPQPFVAPARPKTLPPPMPQRTRTGTQPPQPFKLPPPGSTMPLAQMANRSPMTASGPMMSAPPGPQGAAAHLSAAMTVPAGPASAAMTVPNPPMPAQGPMLSPPVLLGSEPYGTTMPGHGPAGPAPAQPMFYPQATEIPPHSIHAIVVQSQNRRGDGSTAHVAPVRYSVAQPAQRFAPPQLSRRLKIGLGLAGLTVIATVTTMIAIAHSNGASKPAAAPPPPKQTPLAAVISSSGPATPSPSQPAPSAPAPKPPTPAPPRPDPKVAVTPPAPPRAATAPPPPAPPRAATAPAPPVPPRSEPAPPKFEPAPPRSEPAPPKSEPAPVRTAVIARHDPKAEPRPEPPSTHLEPPSAHLDPPSTHLDAKASKRTASADDATEKADQLYHDKKFVDAANVLTAAAKSADAETAKELRSKASRYSAFAKAFNRGMAPGTDEEEAFDQLRSAKAIDQGLGGHFADVITERLRAILPSAATSIVASNELEKARVAVLAADQLGVSSNGSIQAVKRALEKEAGEIYGQARAAGFSTPDGKDKLRKIKAIVDASSPWYQKANAALSGA